MPYTPENNPYIPGDPSSYDLKWMVKKFKSFEDPQKYADAAAASAEESAGYAQESSNSAINASNSANTAEQIAVNVEASVEAAALSAESAADSAHEAAVYAGNIADPVSGIVTDWLEDNITITPGVTIDASLSVPGAAADAGAVGENAFLWRGYLNDLNYTSFEECKKPGWYGFTGAYSSNITDLPAGWSGAGHLEVYKPTFGGSIFAVQKLQSYSNPDTYYLRTARLPDVGTIVVGPWITRAAYNGSSSASFIFRGRLADLGITDVVNCTDNGWYGFGAADVENISDLPGGFNGAGSIMTYNPNLGASIYFTQVTYDTYGNSWYRIVRNGIAQDWHKINQTGALAGKTVAIIGDSISTSGDYDPDTNPLGNVPEICVASEDVGMTLSAYATYYDIGTTIAGYTIQASDVGHLLSFIPTAVDIGKMVGKPLTYYSAPTSMWWNQAAKKLGFTPINVSWSGASVSSHNNSGTLTGAHAWSPGTIKKCGIRTPGSNLRTAPDYIIICRGINDFSHTPYDRLTDGYFDNGSWHYPTTDEITGGYGFKEALCLTIKKLREAYPTAVIVLATLNFFKRVNYSSFPVNNGINTVPQYNQAILEVANYMGCEVIEFDKDGITFENCLSAPFYNDSVEHPTHPNAKGQTMMANRAIIDLNKLNEFSAS